MAQEKKKSGLSLSIVIKLPVTDGSIKYGVLLLGDIFLHGPVSVSLQCYLVFNGLYVTAPVFSNDCAIG